MKGFNGTDIILAIENSLVCIEMFIMALVAGWAYTYKDFEGPNCGRGNIVQIVLSNWYSYYNYKSKV